MSLLEVIDLTQGYVDKPLYDEVSFDVFKGEHVGVVGQNGTGKSTLITMLIGETIPDKGQIKWQNGCRIGHLDQYAKVAENITISAYLHGAFEELYQMEKEIQHLYQSGSENGDDKLFLRAARYQELLESRDFYSIDSHIQKVANGLGLNAIGMDHLLGELSGGQRAKVILAKLLLDEPDVLLLDEPTNFLDKEHVDWLAEYLSQFTGSFIVVSHDFDFLERVTTSILDIEFGTIKKYHGKYSEFLKQKVHLREDYIRQYHAQKKMIERTEEFIRKNIAGVNTKMAQGRRKQLSHLEKLAPPEFTQKPVIHFKEAELTTQVALTVSNLEVGYYFPLLPKLNFHVESGQRLVITGFNGIGKSTLLKTLMGAIPAMAGTFQFSNQVQLGYYEQDLKWEDDIMTPFQIISDAYPGKNRKEIRRILAQCGVKEDHAIQAVGTLSGGEQSRVKLCRMLQGSCNFLILDEPTNHFDAETKEALREALDEFQGSVILVTHEAKFYKGWVDKVLDIEKMSKGE